jgi:hypothetical protein
MPILNNILTKNIANTIPKQLTPSDGGGGGGLVPLTISGLEFFIKADSQYLTFDGTFPSQVAQWDDLSGNDRHVAEASISLQPEYVASSGFNSNPGVEFSVSNELSHAGNGFFSGLTDFTMFAVTRAGTLTDDATIFHEAGGAGDSYLGAANGVAYKMQKKSFANSRNFSMNNANTIVRWQREDIGSGNTTETLFNYGTQLGTAQTEPANVDTTGTIKIGRRFTNSPFVGTIHEVIVYNRLLTTQEITDVEDYLVNEWGNA